MRAGRAGGQAVGRGTVVNRVFFLYYFIAGFVVDVVYFIIEGRTEMK